MVKFSKNKQSGITLISLIITIIIILILAGVTAMTLSGNNGLIDKSLYAKQKAEEADIIENIQEAYIHQYAKNGEIIPEKLETSLEQIYGTGNVEVNENGNEVSINNVVYEIDENGNVSRKRDNLIVGRLQFVDSSNDEIMGKIATGTTAYIRFTVNNGTDIVVKDSSDVTIEKDGEFYKKEVTDNGEYEFVVTGNVDGEKITVRPSITVNSFFSIPTGLSIGSVVKYEPTGIYNWDAEYATSYTASTADYTNASKTLQTVETGRNVTTGNQDMSVRLWRVLSIDENTGSVDLVPATINSNEVKLHGAQGYNNAVNLLDEACSALYGDTNNEITARNIDMDDIEKIMTDVCTEYNIEAGEEDEELLWILARDNYSINLIRNIYGKQRDNEYTVDNSKYPVIYSLELSRAIGSPYNPSNTGLGVSEKPATKIERSSGTSGGRVGAINGTDSEKIKPKQTYYCFEYNSFKDYLGDIFSNILLSNNTNTQFWIASRCIDIGTYSSRCLYRIWEVTDGRLNAMNLFESNGDAFDEEKPLFPVVSLSSDLLEKAGGGVTQYQFYVNN